MPPSPPGLTRREQQNPDGGVHLSNWQRFHGDPEHPQIRQQSSQHQEQGTYTCVLHAFNMTGRGSLKRTIYSNWLVYFVPCYLVVDTRVDQVHIWEGGTWEQCFDTLYSSLSVQVSVNQDKTSQQLAQFRFDLFYQLLYYVTLSVRTYVVCENLLMCLFQQIKNSEIRIWTTRIPLWYIFSTYFILVTDCDDVMMM